MPCPCQRHNDPEKPCTCKCEHGKIFTEHTEEENTLRDN